MNWKLLKNAVPILISRTALMLETLVSVNDVHGGLKDVRYAVNITAADIANGQHRRKAHEMWTLRVKADIELAKRNVEVITASATTPTELAELEKAQGYLDERKAYFAGMKYWMGEFFDLGESFYRPSWE